MHRVYLLVLIGAGSTGTFAPDRPSTAARPSPEVREDVELARRKTEAGNDVGKLWKLYQWCQETKREKDGKAILKKIVKLDPAHKDANLALGRIFHDGKWFDSQKKIDEYKKEQEVAEKKAQGLVEWKGEWVPAEDVPFLERGLVRDPSGQWVDAERAQKLAEGWIQQDLEWIPPAEKENVTQGLWKCGDQWLSIGDADKYHAEIDTWWRIPSERFHIYTTCERDVAVQRAKRELESAYDDLVRIFGVKPAAPLIVVLLRDSKQYGSFAAGDEDDRRQSTDVRGLSSVHLAYFADQSFDSTAAPLLGCGVGYWDASSDAGHRWGTCSARHALGLSYAEAIDPSPKALELARTKPNTSARQLWDAFYEEKRLPDWFRYGVAAYVERYYTDTTSPQNPDWTRKWSVTNIQGRGGLRPLKQVFEFNLTVDGGLDSAKLINEAGLMVAYAIDGPTATVGARFKKLQEAIASGADKKAVTEAAKALEAEIVKHEADLKKFAGL